MKKVYFAGKFNIKAMNLFRFAKGFRMTFAPAFLRILRALPYTLKA
jgi:hypothetical protein